MNSDKKSKKPDKASKCSQKTKGPVASGLEDHRVKLPDKNASNTSKDACQPSSSLKVEMQTLRLSKELESKMLDTLRHLYGENLILKNRSEYRDKGSNLGGQYWFDRGGLVVLGGVDYSQKNRKKTFAEQNAFAISKLEAYGFHRSHCVEILETTGGDVGSSLELLFSHYFHLDPPQPSRDSPETTQEDILELRSDEQASLESMYEKAFEVRLPNRVWALKLDLPYLIELYPDPKIRSSAQHVSNNRAKRTNNSRKEKSKELCNFIASGKVCKYGDKCRFSHQILQAKEENTAVPEDNQFTLEVRFPPGSKYPHELPCVLISTASPHFPPPVCLRLTSYLIAEAREWTSQGIPCVFSLVDLLLNQQDKILESLKTIGEAFPDPATPLLGSNDPDSEISTSDSEQEAENEKKVSKRNRKASINLAERQREDDKLAHKFLDKKNNQKYQHALRGRKELPAWHKMVEIIETIERFQVVVISGETGCGKSTQVPQFVLDDWLLNRSRAGSGSKTNCEIVCTQPRRLSAIGVAERVAEERAERIGDTIGYQIRLESKMSSATRLLFCTTGILLRRLENDPKLSSVTHVVVDEVHERSEESDFLLLILRELLPQRPDLRVILMSATLNSHLFSSYFKGVPTIEIPGRTFPVQQLFLDEVIEKTNYVLEEDSPLARKIKEKRKNGLDFDQNSVECELNTADVLAAIGSQPKDNVRDEMLSLSQLMVRYSGKSMRTVKSLYLMEPEKINYELIETVLTWIVAGDHEYPQKGSILVFLPGIAEIRTLHNQLSNHPVLTPRNGKIVLVPLHSSLTSEEQAAVFQKPKGGARKIVLSTNIAETSITIDDCVFVVDTGRMKEKRFDTNKNMESLDLAWVSRANAAQRRGRAGRVMPGVCVHLYTSYRYNHQFLAQPIPELHRIPLEQLILRIKVLPNFMDYTVHQVFNGMLEPPEVECIDTAIVRLQNVGAVNEHQNLTPLGHHLAQLPVDVRIGKLMLFGAIFCCVDSVLTIAACLSYKSPFSAPFNKKEAADAKKKEFAVANSDQLTALKAYTSWLKASATSRRAGDVFAEENFLSWRTLVTIADMKHQFLELLADIGFVSVDARRRTSGLDRVLECTGSGLNEHGDNHRLLTAILCAALYPNIVKVMTPAKTYAPSIVGAIPKQLRPDEIMFKTKQDGYVHIHPSSVNFSVGHFQSPYLMYQEKVKTSRVFVRDCSMVAMLPLVLFTGKEVVVELHRGTTVLSLEEGWIMFSVESHQVAELLLRMRTELNSIMRDKIKDPTMNLFTNSRSKKVISTIIALITQG